MGRALAFACALSAIAACAKTSPQCPAPPTQVALPTLWSEPEEYRDRPISAAVGAEHFLRLGVGDPYAAGMALPVVLALMKAYPELLGGDFRGFDRKFGTFPDPTKPAGPATPPLGLHLTRDPNTLVFFVVGNCQLCHARRLRLPSGDQVVSGLGNERIRIHAWDAALAKIARDPSLTTDRLLALSNEAAKTHDTPWPADYRRAIVETTLRLLRERDRARGDDALALEHAPTGRVATIESFTMALNHQTGSKIARPSQPGWAKVPDVIGFPHRDTLSWDGVGIGAPTALAAEADFAFGARPVWYDTHRHIGTSMFLYLRAFSRSLPFPAPIDATLAKRGNVVFDDACARCHGTYSKVDGERRTTYRERVVPLAEVGTDPARLRAVTQPFVDASNALPITRGLTLTKATNGYVPPVLFDVWARAPFGHAGQWPDLKVLATRPEDRPKRVAIDFDAPYQLATVGLKWSRVEGPSEPGLGVEGHPFLSDLPAADRDAVIAYLETL